MKVEVTAKAFQKRPQGLLSQQTGYSGKNG